MKAPVLGNDKYTRMKAITVIGVMLLILGSIVWPLPSKKEETADAKESISFQVRQQALTIAKMETTWRVLSEETVVMTEDEGSPSDYKTTLCLAPDNGQPAIFWEFRSNRTHHMPYKALWQELMKESLVRLEFREDPFSGDKTYDYLIPRLEPGSPHSSL